MCKDSYVKDVLNMDVRKLDLAIEEFSTYFGARPDSGFPKFVEFWDAQFEVFFRGFQAGMKADTACKPKPGKAPPDKKPKK